MGGVTLILGMDTGTAGIQENEILCNGIEAFLISDSNVEPNARSKRRKKYNKKIEVFFR